MTSNYIDLTEIENTETMLDIPWNLKFLLTYYALPQTPDNCLLASGKRIL